METVTFIFGCVICLTVVIITASICNTVEKINFYKVNSNEKLKSIFLKSQGEAQK